MNRARMSCRRSSLPEVVRRTRRAAFAKRQGQSDRNCRHGSQSHQNHQRRPHVSSALFCRDEQSDGDSATESGVESMLPTSIAEPSTPSR